MRTYNVKPANLVTVDPGPQLLDCGHTSRMVSWKGMPVCACCLTAEMTWHHGLYKEIEKVLMKSVE